MKGIIYTIALICFSSHSIFAQIYKNKDKAGKVHFFSATPMENIEANTNTAISIINTSTDSVNFRIQISSFQFKNSLMQSHFNENYMESEKFPTASLRGKINEQIDYKKDGTYKVTANCNVTIHGITKPYQMSGTITIKGSEIQLISKFDVKLVDHKIEVPKLVMSKIAENIAVDVDFTYIPFVRK
jgi:polyisoprenoid-binding protein YceI